MNSWAKNILFISLGVMSSVLLVTSSLWMYGSKTLDLSKSFQDRAIVSLVFVMLAIILSGVAFFKLKTDGFDKKSFGLLSLIFLLLLIVAVVPMDDQNKFYKSFHGNAGLNLMSGIISTTSTPIKVSENLFPVALTFLLVPGVSFVSKAAKPSN